MPFSTVHHFAAACQTQTAKLMGISLPMDAAFAVLADM